MDEYNKARATNAPDKTIGELVAEDYRTAQVFEKYGIDFCCGGKAFFNETCRRQGIDGDAILSEIAESRREPIERGRDYGAWALPFLIDYIINAHHGYLNEDMGPIAGYAHKIADVHGSNHPEVIEIAAIFDQIVAGMTAHLREEEDVLFPAIKRIDEAKKAGVTPLPEDAGAIQDSLVRLGREHEEIGDAVHKIRHLSGEYAIPADVCNTFVLTYKKLKEFEDDLHMHVHLENNILFPKAAHLAGS